MFGLLMQKRLEDLRESQKNNYVPKPLDVKYEDLVDFNKNRSLGQVFMMARDPWTIWAYLNPKNETLKRMKQLSKCNKIKICVGIFNINGNHEFEDSFEYDVNSAKVPDYYFNKLSPGGVYISKFNIEGIGEILGLGKTGRHGESNDKTVNWGYGWWMNQ